MASLGKKTAKKPTKAKAVARKELGKSKKAKKRPGKKKAAAHARAGKKAGRTRVKSPTTARAKKVSSRKSTRPPRPSTFSAALKLYEAGFKLMQSEKFPRAKTTFEGLIKEFPNETELVDRASVLIQACDNRIEETKRSPRLRGADEYYEVGVAELNSHELDKAREHLQHALKLSPRGDHILYALAAASALNGEREAALDFLRKAIEYRDENRFLALNDDDFESLAEDAAFIELVTPGD